MSATASYIHVNSIQIIYLSWLYLCELLSEGYGRDEGLQNFKFTLDLGHVVGQALTWLLRLGSLLLADHMFAFCCCRHGPGRDGVIATSTSTTTSITYESHCEKWTLWCSVEKILLCDSVVWLSLGNSSRQLSAHFFFGSVVLGWLGRNFPPPYRKTTSTCASASSIAFACAFLWWKTSLFTST